MSKELRQLRNIGVMAHIDAGKTTVTERILYFAGRTYKIGEVHDGTAVMDYLEEEQQRGITITSAATTFSWSDHTINLIDTPGHVDFTIEVERSLHVLDGAVAVFCGVAGVEAQSETVWQQADRYRVPRMCFVNKLDRLGADFEMAIGEIASRLCGNPIVLQLPMGAADEFVGQIDVLRRKAYFYEPDGLATRMLEREVPDEYRDQVEVARHELIEKAAEADDELMEKYLADESAIVEADIVAAIRRGTLSGELHPVLCGSALKHMGTRLLLNAVVDYLPSPLDMPPVRGHKNTQSDVIIERSPSGDEPFSAIVFKIISDQHGDLNFIRVYSGTLKAGTRVLNSTHDKKEIVSRIWEMHAKQRIRREEALPGDIVAVVGLKVSLTGDTLCDPRHPIVLERLIFPDPVITMSIEPRTNADKQRLADSLNSLRREDPSFKYRYDSETGQTTISGMGELHLEIVKNKLIRDAGLGVHVGRPSVAYKETIQATAEAEGRFIRQTGGRGQFGVVLLRVEPYVPAKPDDEPITFEDATKGGVVPREYISSVARGVNDAATSGPLAGYPLLNIKATLLDGKYHPVDSSDIAFQQAATLAFNAAVEKASPVFLEPIMRLQVTTPGEYLGAVTGDLNSRRAEIKQVEHRGRFRVLQARVPLAEMFGYATQLRSLTQGRGTSTMEPHSYAPSPVHVAEQILRYV
ncbi:MAG: elongation factor G [Planctomycetota bacterium]|nr:elongation factor G [Planctomycetota bacterium]